MPTSSNDLYQTRLDVQTPNRWFLYISLELFNNMYSPFRSSSVLLSGAQSDIPKVGKCLFLPCRSLEFRASANSLSVHFLLNVISAILSMLIERYAVEVIMSKITWPRSNEDWRFHGIKGWCEYHVVSSNQKKNSLKRITLTIVRLVLLLQLIWIEVHNNTWVIQHLRKVFNYCYSP